MTSVDLQQLVLLPETQARRALSGQRLLVRVLAPVGPYAGVGALRVLRLRPRADSVELDCGYESYHRLS